MRKILIAIIAFFLVSPAFAQTTSNSYMALQKIAPAAVRFVQGTDSAGTYKTLYTGGTNGSVCYNIMLNANDQTASHTITLRYVTAAAVSYDICVTTTAPANPAIGANLFGAAQGFLVSNICPAAISQAGNTYMQLKSGDTLQATFGTALTAGDQINIVAQCGDY